MKFTFPPRSSVAAPFLLSLISAGSGYLPAFARSDDFNYTALCVRDPVSVCGLASVYKQAKFRIYTDDETEGEELTNLATTANLSNVTVHIVDAAANLELPETDILIASASVAFGDRLGVLFDALIHSVSSNGILLFEYPSEIVTSRVNGLWELGAALHKAFPNTTSNEHLLAVARRQILAFKDDEFAQSLMRLLQTSSPDVGNLRHAQRSDEVIGRLAESQFSYAGQVDVSRNDPVLSVSRAQAPMLQRLSANKPLKELLTDVIRGDVWRQDIYIRASEPQANESAEWLDENLRFVSRNINGEWNHAHKLLDGSVVSLKGPAYDELSRGIAKGDRCLGDMIAARPQVKNSIMRRAALRMVGSGQFWMVRGPIRQRVAVEEKSFRFKIAGEYNLARYHRALAEKTGCEFTSDVTQDAAISISYPEVLAVEKVLGGDSLKDACDIVMKDIRDEAEAHRIKTGRPNRQVTQVETNIGFLRRVKTTNMLALGVIEES